MKIGKFLRRFDTTDGGNYVKLDGKLVNFWCLLLQKSEFLTVLF
jgi:hypothetical protein